MKFIQDKMNDQGTVGYVMTSSTFGGLSRRHYLISDAVADASSCTLHVTEKTTGSQEQAGTPNFDWEDVVTSISLLRDVDSIEVESFQDHANRQSAEAAHPEITHSVTPTVYGLFLNATKNGAFSLHSAIRRSKEPPEISDRMMKQIIFTFRDEHAADRIAKAMTHAVEICGGGSKEPF
jgi:hypothetical protein